MKTQFLIMFLIGVLGMTTTYAQTSKHAAENVKSTLESFFKSAETSNLQQLQKLLHQDFRVVLNRAFGSTDALVWSKDDYLEMIKSGKIGGIERSNTFESIDVNGTTAMVKVVTVGPKMTFVSYYGLIQTIDGDWKIVQDIPYVRS